MPTCPGCGVSVGYDELRTHVGTCEFVWSERPGRTDRLTQHLVEEIRTLEDRLQTADTARESSNSEDDDRARADRTKDHTRRVR